jgi:hypothetical protein
MTTSLRTKQTFVTVILHFEDGRVREHKLASDEYYWSSWLTEFIASPWPAIYIHKDPDTQRLFETSPRFVLRETEPIRHYYEDRS